MWFCWYDRFSTIPRGTDVVYDLSTVEKRGKNRLVVHIWEFVLSEIRSRVLLYAISTNTSKIVKLICSEISKFKIDFTWLIIVVYWCVHTLRFILINEWYQQQILSYRAQWEEHFLYTNVRNQLRRERAILYSRCTQLWSVH